MRGRMLFVYGVGLAVIAMLALGYSVDVRLIKNASFASAPTAPEQKVNQELADKVVRGIIYIKDPRTNLYFAYYKDSGSIAAISSGVIERWMSTPSDILFEGVVEKKK